ncbi:MAG: tetratricopeptide repeat protein [Prolixibacteraceae bacterium]|nr:tetratricopeptide repeat protein [Prolixibacteraceae bacterium]
MKTLMLKPILLTLAVALMLTYAAVAQRVIKGTVYREGKVAAGVTVEGQKSTGTFMTSFDGIYEITVPEKCKYLKFTFIDDARKLDIEGNTNNVIDFSFDGTIPVAVEETETGAILKTAAELIAVKDKDYMSTYTLEKQFYDQKDYKSSLGPWRILYKTYPKSSVNIYIHGLNIYQTFIEGTTDRKMKDLYIDTLMQVYDHRIKYFDQKGMNLGRQGADYLKYKLDRDGDQLNDDQRKSILKKGYAYLQESVKIQGLESEAPVLILLMNSTRGLYGLGEFGKEKVVESYDIVSKIVSNYLAKEPASEKFISTRNEIDRIFQSSGAADCEALISIYEPKFDQIAANLEDLKKMLRMLDRQNCDGSSLFAKASEKLYQLEPSAEAAYNMARLFVKADQLDKAETYYKQAIDSEKDPLNLAKYYLELGQLNFQKPQLAKTYLKKSIENNPSAGKAYVMLGDLYAHNSKSYGESDFEKSQVFWVAVDYYAKGKKVDPTVEAEANQKIGTYSQYFPPKEEIFFNGLTVGQSITLGGWIGESTTIREKR